MKSGSSDVVDVAGSQTFLAGRRFGEFEFDASEEVIFELVHSCGGEEYRRIPSRHQYIARLAYAAFGFKKF